MPHKRAAPALVGAILVDALDHGDIAIALMPELIAADVEKALQELWAATPAERLLGGIRIVRQPEDEDRVRMVADLGA